MYMVESPAPEATYTGKPYQSPIRVRTRESSNAGGPLLYQRRFWNSTNMPFAAWGRMRIIAGPEELATRPVVPTEGVGGSVRSAGRVAAGCGGGAAKSSTTGCEARNGGAGAWRIGASAGGPIAGEISTGRADTVLPEVHAISPVRGR